FVDAARVRSFGLRGGKRRTRLCNFFRARPIAQAQQCLLLCRNARLGFVHARQETFRLEPREYLTRAHAVSFAHEHFRDALVLRERQLDLADVHIAVEHDSVIIASPREEIRDEREKGECAERGNHDLLLVHRELARTCKLPPLYSKSNLNFNWNRELHDRCDTYEGTQQGQEARGGHRARSAGWPRDAPRAARSRGRGIRAAWLRQGNE